MDNGSTLTSVFWIDNFYKNIENESGGVAANMTVIIAFQETNENSTSQ